MPMGLYPLRVKILQSGNITHMVRTPDEEEVLRFPNVAGKMAPTTQVPPSPVTSHHRSDIPPEEEFTGGKEIERPDTYTAILTTPSSILPNRSVSFISSFEPTTTPVSPPQRPPYTVRVTNKWVEETLAKVKTVVDSILKSIGSARGNLEEKNSSKKRDGGNRGGEMGAKKSKVKRRGARRRYDEERKRRYRNNEEQGKTEVRRHITRREGIEIERLRKKSHQRSKKGKTQGNRRRTKRRKRQSAFDNSAEKKAGDKGEEKNSEGENTETLLNEHKSREKRKQQTRINALISTTKGNKNLPNNVMKNEEPNVSNGIVQEFSRFSAAWKDKVSLSASTPTRHIFEGFSVDERESIKSMMVKRDGGGVGLRERGKGFAIDTEEFRDSKDISALLSAVSQEEGVPRHRGGRHVRDNSDIVHSNSGSKDFSDENVFIPKRYSVLDSEEVYIGSHEKNIHMKNIVDSGDNNIVSLGASSAFSTKISSNVNSGKNENKAGSGSVAPAPKQAISSVTDLLFTVPNERVIRPAQNSQVQSEIKSTEKLIRTSLEDLLFRVPPVGSRQTQESPGLKTPTEAESTDATTTTSPYTTSLPRELISPDDTEVASVDIDTKVVTGGKQAEPKGFVKRGRKEEGSGGEVPHDTVYQRKNITEKRKKKEKGLESEEETDTEGQEEAGDLILRTACLPLGSIGRFKVEGVTYLVTGTGSGARAEDCWREVTNVVNRHIRLPAVNHTTLLATTAFYFVAASSNLIGELRLLVLNRKGIRGRRQGYEYIGWKSRHKRSEDTYTAEKHLK